MHAQMLLNLNQPTNQTCVYQQFLADRISTVALMRQACVRLSVVCDVVY